MTRVCTHIILLALASLISLSKTSTAQIRNQVFVGTRPLSLGGAFVAVADDGNAIYWNPAGLARMERIQASFNYADLFGLGIDNYHASFLSRVYFIPPLTDYLTFGVDWSGIHTGDKELEFTSGQFNFSLAFQPPKRLPALADFSFGVNAKYLKLTGELDNHLEAQASGWGWDFGILYHLSALPYMPKGLNFGLMVHDVGGTKVRHETNRRETIHRQNVRWGLSYRPFEAWPGGKIPVSHPLIALDFDDRVHIGLEFWLANTLALRAGLQKDFNGDEGASLSFGVGFKANVKGWPEANVDYALTDSPVLPNTGKQFGGSLIIKENPRLVRIEGAHVNEVFASRYSSYGKRGSKFGVIKLKNVHDKPIEAAISFLAGDYAHEHTPDTLIIKPDSTVDHEIRAFFKREILQAREKLLSGEVKVSYEYKDAEVFTTAKVNFALYEKNYITWDDPAAASAFVTPQDPSVKKFGAQVLHAQEQVTKQLINGPISHAQARFEGLAAYRLGYKPDANLPFARVLKTKYYFDTVQYPSEILSKDNRLGDCDDLSVLYASLLEEIGIATALLSIPRHLFMMFDTGIPVNQRYRFLMADSMLVVKDGTIWLPIEMTGIDSSSFAQAWQEGIRRYGEAERDSTLQIYAVREGWSKYEPTPPDLPAPASFDLQNLHAGIDGSLSTIEEWNRQYLERNYFEALRREPGNLPVRNLLGILYAQNGKIEEAKQQFEEAYRRNPKYLQALKNLANVYFIKANYQEAERYYQKVLEEDPYAAGIYLNLAILYHWRKDVAAQDTAQFNRFEEKSFAELEKAGRLLNHNTELALELLGLPDEAEEEQQTKAISATDWKRLWNSFKQGFYRVFKPKKPTTPTPQSAAPKAGEPDTDRAAILWWSK